MLDLYDSLVGPAPNLLRTALLGVLGYTSLVLLLRVSGKRTLSKLNAFDLVVTVALGSSLATTLLSNDTSWMQGLVAFSVLTGMQYLVAALAARSDRVAELVQARPTLVYFRGEVLRDTVRRERLTVEELEAAARSSGMSSLREAHAVILETDGSLSVLSHASDKLKRFALPAPPR